MILQLHKSQPSSDICLVELSGKLIMGNDSRQVERTVEELLGNGVKKIVLELSKLDNIDSTGVGIIVMCDGKSARLAEQFDWQGRWDLSATLW